MIGISLIWMESFWSRIKKPLTCSDKEKCYADNRYPYTMRRFTFTATDVLQTQIYCQTTNAHIQVALNFDQFIYPITSDADGELWIAYVSAGQDDMLLYHYDQQLNLLNSVSLPETNAALETLYSNANTLYCVFKSYGGYIVIPYDKSISAFEQSIWIDTGFDTTELRDVFTYNNNLYIISADRKTGYWNLLLVDKNRNTMNIFTSNTQFVTKVQRKVGAMDIISIDDSDKSLLIQSLTFKQ